MDRRARSLPGQDQGSPGLEDRVPLRLSASRGMLGLELYEPLRVAPLQVDELGLTWPQLSFPVDLSGGVRAFRHRRGRLETAVISADLPELREWLAPRLRDVVRSGQQSLELWRTEAGVGIGVTLNTGALAFELLWLPDAGLARWVVANERVAGVEAAALKLALSVVDTAFGKLAERNGRIISFVDGPARVAKALLPPFGVRVPDMAQANFGELSWSEQRLSVRLDPEASGAALRPKLIRAFELAQLTAAADEQLAAGDEEGAREGYLAALVKAPRDPEIARTVAEIDVHHAGRSEAALGLLVETQQAANAGAIGAHLLAGVRDFVGARGAINSAAARETYAPLAAYLWLQAAAWEPEPRDQLHALNRAVAAAPGLEQVRLARLRARLAEGMLSEVISDAEHIEASARGRRARHEVLCGIAREVADAGYVRDAGRLYERALRYVPDDAAATAGLARALTQTGNKERAVALLERSITLGAEQAGIPPRALLDLSIILAQDYRDLPHAIARAREISQDAPEAVEARLLEGRWCAALGDLVGASQGFAKMRQLIQSRMDLPSQSVAWLREAADFEVQQDDPVAAEKHLSVALRLAPQHRKLGEQYRAVARQVSERSRKSDS